MVPRFPSARLSVGLLVGLAFTLALRADEEELPNPPKIVRRIVVEDDPIPGSNPNLLPDMARALAQAKHPQIKAFFNEFQFTHDRLVDSQGKLHRIQPLPLLFPTDKFPDPFGIIEIDDTGKSSELLSISPSKIRRIEPLERFALTQVKSLIEPGPTVPPSTIAPKQERLAGAERLLTQVLFFHENAISQNKRRGKSWAPFQSQMLDQLTSIRVELVREFAQNKDWARLRELTLRLSERYRSNPELLQDLLAYRLLEADDLLQSDSLNDLESARDLLLDFENQFPTSDHPNAKRVRAKLTERAKEYLSNATRLAKVNEAEARNMLRTVEALDPEQPGLRDLQRELRAGYSSLVVGIRRTPELFSPARARFETEQWVVDLLFEGLLEALPDDKRTRRFVPALAMDLPQVGTLTRTFDLIGNAEWSGPGRDVFDTADLSGTIQLLKQKRSMPSAESVDWLDDILQDPRNPAQVSIQLLRGHPDPRELLRLKMLPAKYLQSKNKSIDDDDFAKRPFGTGPFRLEPSYRPPAPGDAPRDVVLWANAAYAKRPGRLGQPAIKEIRLINTRNLADLVNEVQGERIHLLTDVSTADLKIFQDVTQAKVVTPIRNRTIHYLAINHRLSSLQDESLRRGLIHAIDREKILNEVYRSGEKNYHQALAGPFPVGAWACPKPLGAEPPALFNRALAAAKFRTIKNKLPITLIFANDDPLQLEAANRIKLQIEETSSDMVTITLQPVTPAQLHRRVYLEHRFDLAIMSHDYTSDWYPLELATWLDVTATDPGGRNAGGYGLKSTNPSRDDDTLVNKLRDVTRNRDFNKLRTLSHDIFQRFNERVPFIPLWQIDRHMIVSNKLKFFYEDRNDPLPPQWLEPRSMFTSISRWRLED